MPSTADLMFLALLIALTFGGLQQRLLGDAGTGWHIRNGELILSTHTVTRADPFSSTMQGKPWYAWEWLYDAAIAMVHGWYGLNGVVFVSTLAIAITFSLMFILAQARGASLAATTLLSLLAITGSSIHFLARPHIFSWLLLLGALIWAERKGRSARPFQWRDAAVVATDGAPSAAQQHVAGHPHLLHQTAERVLVDVAPQRDQQLPLQSIAIEARRR